MHSIPLAYPVDSTCRDECGADRIAAPAAKRPGRQLLDSTLIEEMRGRSDCGRAG
jgi:hypothetical protein